MGGGAVGGEAVGGQQQGPCRRLSPPVLCLPFPPMASLTKQQALAAYAANAALAEQHVRYYYYFLATCLASAFAGKLLLQAEARWWTRRSSRRGQVDMGYDMSPSPEDMHLRRATLPLLPRLLRAYLAFVRKVRGQRGRAKSRLLTTPRSTCAR